MELRTIRLSGLHSAAGRKRPMPLEYVVHITCDLPLRRGPDTRRIKGMTTCLAGSASLLPGLLCGGAPARPPS